MTIQIFEQALEAGARGRRLNRSQAFALAETITPDRTHALGHAALENRRQRYGDKATYVFNLQINPANICVAGCTFCDYAASKNDAHAYVLGEEEILAKVEALKPTEAHIVGGLNQVWPYERNLALVQQLRQSFPGLHIKAYTAVEIAYFAKTSRKTEEQILVELKTAGVDALPGGGAEIFSDRPAQAALEEQSGGRRNGSVFISWRMTWKCQTNATMLFGFSETWEERIEHLLRLRRAQDESPGFACFIPLAFQPGEGRFATHGPSSHGDTVRAGHQPIDPGQYPAPQIVLAHGGSGYGRAAGLSWGADDMDGTIVEERIAHLAGASTPKGLARERMVETIEMAGFIPCERDGRFMPVTKQP